MRKCLYCDFLSHPPGPGEIGRYFAALLTEVESWAPLVKNHEVRTIFFGGGTPSFAPGERIADCLETIRRCFAVANDAEITLEANPGTITEEKLRCWKEAGVNRLSIGLQSADDGELARLGRIHDWAAFTDNYFLARQCGFTNISVDLMSALPGQTVASWQRTLEQVTSLDPPPEHISAYSLIIEEGTPFYAMYGEGQGGGNAAAEETKTAGKKTETAAEEIKMAAEETKTAAAPLPSEDDERRMYHLTKDFLAARGYERYEISNYAKPGYASRHNRVYWTGGDYLGFGLGASSYFAGRRFAAPDSTEEYLRYAPSPKDLQAYEPLTREEQMEEFMFLGLRMTRGVSPSDFDRRFTEDVPRAFDWQSGSLFQQIYGDVVRRYIDLGLLEQCDGRVRLTDRGVDVSNVVLADFLLV